MFRRLLLSALFLTAACVSAPAQKFEASTLKYLYKVTLEPRGKGYKGIFLRSEYGIHPAKYGFSATVLPDSSKGEKQLLVKFSGWDLKRKGEPYNRSGKDKSLVWRLVETKEGPKLYVPMSVRKGKTQTWRDIQLEFDED